MSKKVVICVGGQRYTATPLPPVEGANGAEAPLDGSTAGGVPPVGPRLRAARRAAGLTQRQLAQEAGLNHVQVYEIERRSANTLRWESAVRLARALGLSLDDLARA